MHYSHKIHIGGSIKTFEHLRITIGQFHLFSIPIKGVPDHYLLYKKRETLGLLSNFSRVKRFLTYYMQHASKGKVMNNAMSLQSLENESLTISKLIRTKRRCTIWFHSLYTTFFKYQALSQKKTERKLSKVKQFRAILNLVLFYSQWHWYFLKISAIWMRIDPRSYWKRAQTYPKHHKRPSRTSSTSFSKSAWTSRNWNISFTFQMDAISFDQIP